MKRRQPVRGRGAEQPRSWGGSRATVAPLPPTFTCFTVERHQHGILVRGVSSMSVYESTALVSSWAAEGWDELRPDLARALGADLVVTNANHRAAWLAELGADDRRLIA